MSGVGAGDSARISVGDSTESWAAKARTSMPALGEADSSAFSPLAAGERSAVVEKHWYPSRKILEPAPAAVIARACHVPSVREAVSSMSKAKAMEFVDPSRKSAPARMDSSQPMASELWSRMSVPSIRARNCRTQEIPGSVVSDCMFVTFSVGVVHCRPHRHGGLWVGRTRICQTG